MTITDLAPTDEAQTEEPILRDENSLPVDSLLGFTPPAEVYYRIYFSHSDMCMDGRSIHRGEAIKQSRPDPKSETQLWKFHRVTQRHYMLICKKSGKALDVPNGRHDDVDMCQWDPSFGEFNEHFRLLPTGDGLFYLVARHSGKRICVRNSGKNDGDAVIQSGEGTTANYRLRIVPDGESKDRVVDRDFVADSNEKMRKLIIDIAGKVPEVGSGLAGFMAMLRSRKADFSRRCSRR